MNHPAYCATAAILRQLTKKIKIIDDDVSVASGNRSVFLFSRTRRFQTSCPRRDEVLVGKYRISVPTRNDGNERKNDKTRGQG